ncbi:cuticle protein 18.6 [Daphnia magna]|uniref:cuticle protein 18.6 n=1 Tax=Daphnia magna TaxID=35525 RepID=UPI001E1BA825|nr:cuticle protein 18.6 [Daphnia magna]
MKITILVVFVMTVAVQGYQSYRTSEYNSPMPYSFSWDVNDYASKNNYAHSESSNGKAVTGSYRVALPDGRTQIVTYRADHNGYVADVKYEGEAKYPEYRPTPSYSFPAYQAPARSYSIPAYRAPAYATYSAPAYAAPVAVQGKRGYVAAPGYNTQPTSIAYRG